MVKKTFKIVQRSTREAQREAKREAFSAIRINTG